METNQFVPWMWDSNIKVKSHEFEKGIMSMFNFTQAVSIFLLLIQKTLQMEFLWLFTLYFSLIPSLVSYQSKTLIKLHKITLTPEWISHNDTTSCFFIYNFSRFTVLVYQINVPILIQRASVNYTSLLLYNLYHHIVVFNLQGNAAYQLTEFLKRK